MLRGRALQAESDDDASDLSNFAKGLTHSAFDILRPKRLLQCRRASPFLFQAGGAITGREDEGNPRDASALASE
jgi:hypothetical protein